MINRLDIPLKGESSLKWVSHILDNFSEFLQDHASCERKAAALAMSFVAKYPDRKALIDPMIALAREELEHFQQVFHLLQKRGENLSSCDQKDSYINEILKQLRHGRDERLLDRLVMSALVEARGCERFFLLSKHLEDKNLQKFYQDLAEKEAGHYKIFIRLARLYFDNEKIDEAISRISDIECIAMAQAPLNATLH